jgi:hypothetical protein
VPRVSCRHPLTYLLTYLRSWALPEKLPIVQPFRKFPAFYGTHKGCGMRSTVLFLSTWLYCSLHDTRTIRPGQVQFDQTPQICPSHSLNVTRYNFQCSISKKKKPQHLHSFNVNQPTISLALPNTMHQSPSDVNNHSNSPQLMKSESSLSHLQQPATDPYPEL